MKIGARIALLLLLLGAMAGCSSAEPQPPPMQPLTHPQSFIVYFAWDDASLSQQAENTIKQFASYIAANSQFRINVVGHTDLSGSNS